MLTVLIETLNDEEGLARTLASLIGGAVEGIVRDVIVCDRGSTDQTHRVADHAGCQYLAEGGLAAGVGQAKADWLMILEPGARLVDGWTEEVLQHMARMSVPARFSRSREDRLSLIGRLFSTPTPLADGLVIRKGQAAALSNAARGAAFARRIASRRIAAEIRVANDRSKSGR